ncbi:MAG: hypothetical protein AB1530_00260 [Candidatus Omnitrophota bacterium]
MSNREETSCVVLGLGVNGLGVVRSLGRNHLRVIGIYTREGELGRHSRYCKAIKFPLLEKNNQEFLDKLCNLGKSLGKAVIFSTNDKYVQFVSDFRDKLSEYFLINLPEKDIVAKMNSKDGIRELAQECGVKIPQTKQINSKADLEYVNKHFNFPVLIKPFKTYNNEYFKGKKNLIVQSPKELTSIYESATGLFSTSLAQEIIRGGDNHIIMPSFYFDKESRPLASCTTRKVRQYLPDYGIACYLKTEGVPKVEEIALSFLQKLKFKGIVLLEFAESVKTGDYYLLEANLRSCYVNQLFSDCGINFSYINYLYLTNPSLLQGLKFKQKNGIYWIDFIRDLASFSRKYKQNKITFFHWFKTALKARSFAIFAFDDLLPAFVSLSLFIRGVSLKRLSLKI